MWRLSRQEWDWCDSVHFRHLRPWIFYDRRFIYWNIHVWWPVSREDVINILIFVFSLYVVFDRKRGAKEGVNFWAKLKMPHVGVKAFEVSFLIGGVALMVFSLFSLWNHWKHLH